MLQLGVTPKPHTLVRFGDVHHGPTHHRIHRFGVLRDAKLHMDVVTAMAPHPREFTWFDDTRGPRAVYFVAVWWRPWDLHLFDLHVLATPMGPNHVSAQTL